MTANLGNTQFTSVTWTAGDTITEAKLDNMVANEQAYDSHASQGLLLNNNKSYAAKHSGGTNYNLMKIDTGDDVIVGDDDLAGHIKSVNGTYQDIVTESDAATVTFDLQEGNVQEVTLGGNRTLALSNEKTGQKFIIRLTQDGTGSRTVTWWSGINWVGGSEPSLTTAANKTDVFAFLITAANTYDGYIVGLNI